MAGNDAIFNGIEIGRFRNSNDLSEAFKKHIKCKRDDIIFFCVGTDTVTGDSYGPFLGSYLEDAGFPNVIGTIDHPVHALNIHERIKEIPEGKTVIAFDSCFGKPENIGTLSFKKGSLQAGVGVGKQLPPVGDFHVDGIVVSNEDDSSDWLKQMLLGRVRLKLILELASITVEAVEMSFGISTNNSIHLSKRKQK